MHCVWVAFVIRRKKCMTHFASYTPTEIAPKFDWERDIGEGAMRTKYQERRKNAKKCWITKSVNMKNAVETLHRSTSLFSFLDCIKFFFSFAWFWMLKAKLFTYTKKMRRFAEKKYAVHFVYLFFEFLIFTPQAFCFVFFSIHLIVDWHSICFLFCVCKYANKQEKKTENLWRRRSFAFGTFGRFQFSRNKFKDKQKNGFNSSWNIKKFTDSGVTCDSKYL